VSREDITEGAQIHVSNDELVEFTCTCGQAGLSARRDADEPIVCPGCGARYENMQTTLSPATGLEIVPKGESL